MFEFFKNSMDKDIRQSYRKPSGNSELDAQLSGVLLDDLVKLRELCNNTSDLLVRELEICGVPVAMVMVEGMFNLQTLTEIVIEPITSLKLKEATAQNLMDWMTKNTILAGDQVIVNTFDDLFTFLMSGFVVILADGLTTGLALGIQGFNFRSISEPTSEVNVRGSREGFVEALRVNMTMVRRRMKTPDFKLELAKVGVKSKTDICLCYRTDMVSQKLLREIRHRLSQIELDNVMESGYIQPFFESKNLSLFTGVGYTERPDTICAKVSEGRVGVLIDGTPFALIIPYLFNENFQSIDDYVNRPYYGTFIRWLKYFSFFMTILLPGVYVAVASFHPELFPDALLFNVATSEEGTPFPLVFEALMIHLIYEVMREAGLRLPRPVGHAVSIVGALVIGDAAVTAGLIGTPMVMVVALTAISSFVVPSLYEPVTILRFLFILLGGTLGLFGIMLGLSAVGVNLCAVNSMGVPTTTPASPFSLYTLRDTLFRWSWTQLGKEDMVVSDLPGSDLDQSEDSNR